MWKSKKIILVLVLAIAALVATTTGVVFAQTENGDESEPEARYEALLDRVCAIYEENTGNAIDSQQLKGALDQARQEMRDEALGNKLQNLVDQGEITQEEADQYKEWWQARPDVELPDRKGPGFGDGMMGDRGFHHRGGPPCAPDVS